MDLDRYDIFIIQADDTIENALQKIEANKYRTLIVIDKTSRVLGTLTDGDIRKALIAKRSQLAPVYDFMNTRFRAVTIDHQEVGKIIFAEHFYINLIPILNQEGLLQGILYRDKVMAEDRIVS